MNAKEFDLSVFVAGDTLFVTVNIPFGATRDDIDTCLFKVETAMARVERIGEKQLAGLLWENKRKLGGSTALVARRVSSDPHYRERFDPEWRRLNTPPPVIK